MRLKARLGPCPVTSSSDSPISPATCSFPQAALLLDVGPTGTTVRFLPLSRAKGVAEAYTLAAAGNAHGQAIAAYAEAIDAPATDPVRHGVPDDVLDAVV